MCCWYCPRLAEIWYCTARTPYACHCCCSTPYTFVRYSHHRDHYDTSGVKCVLHLITGAVTGPESESLLAVPSHCLCCFAAPLSKEPFRAFAKAVALFIGTPSAPMSLARVTISAPRKCIFRIIVWTYFSKHSAKLVIVNPASQYIIRMMFLF